MKNRLLNGPNGTIYQRVISSHWTIVWAFSKKWYGNHLNPDWEKWTMQEARDIFREFNLTGKIWELESSAERF
ncbi:MAG: hypothetical protein WDM78_13695 [Puia sp.]